MKGGVMKEAVNLTGMFIAVVLMVTMLAPSTAAAGSLNPCDLFTKAEAETFLKATISSERSGKAVAPAGSVCTYFYKKKGDTYSLKLKLSSTEEIGKEGIFKSARDAFDRQKKARMANANASKLLKPVTGLGDDAFWSGSDLWIVKGDYLITVLARSPLKGSFKNREAMDKARGEQDLDQSRKVAEKVLPKIK